MQKLSMDDLQLMNALERITGARANDVIVDGDSLIYAVPDSEFGRAIGKHGANIERLQHALNKEVEIVKSPTSKEQFFGSLLHPAIPKEFVEKDDAGRRSLEILVDNKDRGFAIGRNGEKIKRAKLLGKRYFDYCDVKIITRFDTGRI
ncbi:MAG: NusA-like transcription termination signal-binding factor [Candidatus Micrarchaeota archaeon]